MSSKGTKVVCECGTELLKTSLKAHLTTEKHKKLLLLKQGTDNTQTQTQTKQAVEKLMSYIIASRFRNKYIEDLKINKPDVEVNKERAIIQYEKIYEDEEDYISQQNVKNFERLKLNSGVLNKMFQFYKLEEGEKESFSIQLEHYLLDKKERISRDIIYHILEINLEGIKNKDIEDFDKFMGGGDIEIDNMLNIIEYFIKYIEMEYILPDEVEYKMTKKIKQFYDYHYNLYDDEEAKEYIEIDLTRLITYFNLKGMNEEDYSYENYENVLKKSYEKFKKQYLNTKLRIYLIESLIEITQNELSDYM